MKLAAVQIRGAVGMNRKLIDTLQMLKLVRKNSCVVVENNRNYLGMLVLLKDYITWGEINNETMKLLLEKRGRITGNKPLTEQYLKENAKMSFDDFVNNVMSSKINFKDVPGLKTFFRLKPPKGGFDRGGIKKPYSLGGALGYRKDAINDLVKRML
ncbi:50S ribosomal protein L30 [Candidatus Woesearchaeota archaeon]|nr:50S ribosomal protein L30 [Candidatus Woesearchaeota archaeon]